MTGLEPFGFREAAEKARNFAKNQTESVEKVLTAAAEVYIDAVKIHAPSSGQTRGAAAYKNSIKIIDAGLGFRKVGSDYFVISRSTGRQYTLGAILEYGSHAHVIEPILAESLMWISNGVPHFSMHVEHPGTAPQPHFMPAIPTVKEHFPNLYKHLVVEALWV
jgi:hypothetical protein